MNNLDWLIIVAYIIGMVGLSLYWGRGQENAADYYVGGRKLPWWALGISTMATQSSANSFIGIPAFVALTVGGGLTWLQYELAVPLAMIFIMCLLIPFFRSLKLISVYEYLEMRFGSGTRYFISAVFLISRIVGTAAGVFAAAVVVSVGFSIPLWSAILLIGIVTIIYDTIAGMKGVVYSDVIQMSILLLGLGFIVLLTMNAVGGFEAMFSSLSEERRQAFNFSTGINDGSKAPFWAFLIGGFFLYASYYGVDQSQTQRTLSSPTIADSKRALFFNGLARFPLTILYLLLGVAAGAAYQQFSLLQEAVPADNPNALIPQLILFILPQGIRGILMAALLAAAMSSFDSALNSLSAVFVRDFVQRGKKFKDRQLLIISKLSTVAIGLLITFIAFFINKAETVVETINKIGSAFYGPLLAAFVLGLVFRRTTGTGVVIGVLVGVITNLILWQANIHTELYIHWMWWNLVGFVVTVLLACLISPFTPPPSTEKINQYTLSGTGILKKETKWIPIYIILFGYFCLMLVIGIALNSTAG